MKEDMYKNKIEDILLNKFHNTKKVKSLMDKYSLYIYDMFRDQPAGTVAKNIIGNKVPKNYFKENKMSNENIVQQIIDKTNDGKDDNPKIYKLQWASGHQNIVSLTEAVEVVNRWANQKGWQWIKIVNTENNKQQVVYESATRIGRKLNKLNEDMLTAK